MADGISMGARREVLAAVAYRYRAAGRREKGRILDELTATTGWHRKHAVRALSQRVAAPVPSGSMNAAVASAVGDDDSLPRRRCGKYDGIRLVFQPAHSPELQPAEHLWPFVDEPLANRCFASIASLDQAVGDRCVALAQQQEMIRNSTLFHWWPGQRARN